MACGGQWFLALVWPLSPWESCSIVWIGQLFCTNYQRVSCFQIGPVTSRIYKANIQQHGVIHHFLVLGKSVAQNCLVQGYLAMTPESETNLSEYVMMLCC